MIASRIGLVVACVIALALGVIVVVDRPDTSPTSRALVTHFDTDKIMRLVWSHGGAPELAVERVGTAWRWTKPIADIPADPAAIDAVIAALRGGRWHRRARIAKAGTLRTALTVTAGDRTLEIGIGDGLPGADQAWIAVGDRAYLVDSWIVRALTPDPLALRKTRPLEDAPAAPTIVIDRLAPYRFAVRLEGTPLRRMVRPVEVVLNAQYVAALHRALSQLTIIGLPKTIAGESFVAMTITIDAPRLITVEFRSEGCEAGNVAISGTFGPGCISQADMQAVEETLNNLRMPSTLLADPQPVRTEPVKITLPDGGVLDLEKRPRIGDRDADPQRVLELLAVLQSRLDVVDSSPSIKATGSLVVVDRAGETITLDLLADLHLRRRGEPVSLVLGTGSWQILTRPSAALRDPTLWTEEATTIRTITVDGTVYSRGAVVGEWSPDKRTQLEPLAQLLAKPRATDAPRPPAKVLHTVAFETAPPSGPPVTRTLQLGERCAAIVDGKPLQLEPKLCELVATIAQAHAGPTQPPP